MPHPRVVIESIATTLSSATELTCLASAVGFKTLQESTAVLGTPFGALAKAEMRPPSLPMRRPWFQTLSGCVAPPCPEETNTQSNEKGRERIVVSLLPGRDHDPLVQEIAGSGGEKCVKQVWRVKKDCGEQKRMGSPKRLSLLATTTALGFSLRFSQKLRARGGT